MTEVLSVFPISIDYAGIVDINPSATGNLDNFITANSTLIGGLDVDLPLKFRNARLAIIDTLTTEPIIEKQPQEIDSIQLILDVKNDLPFDGLLSIISTRLGTESIIFEDIELSAAAIDSDGKVTQTTEERITIDLDRPQIERLLSLIHI